VTHYSKPVGVSILTNGNRLSNLQTCLGSFLSNCYYRPVEIGIFDNGSTDGTAEWIQNWIGSNHPWKYGVTWRSELSLVDLGCAEGTNRSIEMMSEFEFQVHLESDFVHLPESNSGIGKLWLRDAVGLLDEGLADYIYLRRMRSEQEAAMHWFPQWKDKIREDRGPFKRCEGFWWSNNPSVFRTKAMYDCKTLPLNSKIDGSKGTSNWSRPELETPRPNKTWMWGYGEGMFVHEG